MSLIKFSNPAIKDRFRPESLSLCNFPFPDCKLFRFYMKPNERLLTS